jgi:cellulose synthase/poly-beta-1,6-N-acetylglucosamine synthase-like glycosyltransferase
MAFLEFLYAVCAVLLSIYGFNSLALVWLYLRHRNDPVPTPPPPAPDRWPHVTVQLPVYNELHTVERLLAAAAALDYPHDRLEIQLLDDSTDNTRRVAARAIARLRQQGVDVKHVTRADRSGFKAGALAAGLTSARGDLIAVFDADFVPPSGFLRQVVPHFADPAIGCVQTRWAHLNHDYSPFTRAQATGIDGHFVVEQTARNRAGLFIGFNGSGGVWRRSCIEDAGGWQADTLTEDLDLSYRAQMRGWRIRYLPHVLAPAELPAQVSGFKRQQARWAQGSTETAVKLIGPLLRSDQPWPVKLEGCIHLTAYLVSPIMLLTILLILPMSFSHSWVLGLAPWLMIAATGPPVTYAVAQLATGRRPREWLGSLPILILTGVGVTLSNSLAAIKGLLGIRQPFLRTPKFALEGRADTWAGSAYALTLRRDMVVWGELALALFALSLLFLPGSHWGFAPWALLNGGGFGYVAGLTLLQARQRRRWLARRPAPTADRAVRTPGT